MPIIEFGFNGKAVTTGVNKVKNDLASISTTASTVGSGLRTRLVTPMTAAIVGVGAAVAGIVRSTQVGDQYTEMAGQLEYLTGSTENAEIAQESLYQMSQKTGSSMLANASAFTRFSMASDQTGLSTEQNVQMLGNINTIMAKTGVNSTEAANAMIQLGQALASGKLQGDEYKTMAESTPAIMRAIADSIGIPIGQLKEYASQGKLTSKKVAVAFLNMGNSSKTFPLTVGRSLTKVNNAYQRLSDKLIDQSGILTKIASAFENLAIFIEKSTPAIVLFAKGFNRAFSGAYPYVKSFFSGIWNGITKIIGIMSSSGAIIPTFFSGIGAISAVVWPIISTFFTGLFSIATKVFKFFSGSGGVVPTLINAIVTAIQAAQPFIQSFFTGLLSIATKAFEFFYSSGGIIPTFFTMIVTVVQAAWPFIQSFFTNLWSDATKIVEWFTMTSSDPNTGVSGFFTTIANTANGVWPSIKTIFSNLWEGAKIIVGWFTANNGIIATFWTAIVTAATEAWPLIKDFLSVLWTSFKEVLAWFAEKYNGIPGFLNSIADTVILVWPTISNFLNLLWTGAKEVVNWFLNNSGIIPGFVDVMLGSFERSLLIINGFISALKTVLSLISKATAAASAVTGDLSVKVEQTVSELSVGDILNPIPTIVSGVSSVIDSVTGPGVEAWNDPYLTGGGDTNTTNTTKNSTVNINVAEKVSRSDITNIANGLALNDGRI